MRSKLRIAVSVLCIGLIPLLLYLLWKSGNRYYYLAGLGVIILSSVPFILSFEARMPKARELVILAVMSALAVASRAAFIWLPNFKPMGAIIMIAGIVFGPQSGFLVGSVSVFVSNFLFGQGAWTPWQMFAFGIAGLLAGVLARIGILNRNRVRLTVFGFLTTVLVVGPILDTATIFLMGQSIAGFTAKAVYLSGLPVNLVHASAVALAMFFFSRTLFEKLDRVQMKYGMME